MKVNDLLPASLRVLFGITLLVGFGPARAAAAVEKTRVLVLSDGEIDDQCSLIRFLLYANEFDVEGLIKTSSQYHWQGSNWAGDDWEKPIFEAYGKVYPNLIKHDPGYPTLAYLQSVTKLGNVKAEGEMTLVTPGSQRIVDVLLDETDNRPIWVQAWGGMNTLARALKTIEETHPEKMKSVAAKLRFYFIWEQDGTFQSYIRAHWETPYNIPTIISDQFITFGYWWQRWSMPAEPDSYLRSAWMKENIFKVLNPLTTIYNANTKTKLGGKEDFIGEGDSPSFIHAIATGLRNQESPDWGGWGGSFVRVRENTWLDKVPVAGYEYPSGRWYTSNAWGKNNLTGDQNLLKEYFKPTWRWIDVVQNDFAARVSWCTKSYAETNHQPVVKLANALDLQAKPGVTVSLSAKGTTDPDGDKLTYKWWQFEEADTYDGVVAIQNADQQDASFVVPTTASTGKTIHIVCEVKDNGSPQLTRYQRVVVTVNPSATGLDSREIKTYGKTGFTSSHLEPSNRTVQLRYTIPEASDVELSVFNSQGRQVGQLFRGRQGQGDHEVAWNPRGSPSGTFFGSLHAGTIHETMKFVIP